MNRDAFAPGFGSSFYDYLVTARPDLLPAAAHLPPGAAPAGVPHGTTVLAVRFADGVLVAGDRMASDGYQVSSRRIDKVIRTDDFSAMAISGAVGPCLEMAKLFSTELEYYEKIEGRALSLSGKANKLGQMVRGNLPLAMQGLAVIPLFAGYDPERGTGRVFKYDVAGGRTEETDYVVAGSGSGQARGALKKGYRTGLDEAGAVRLAIDALLEAADEDLGTGGPDPARGIYPTVLLITPDGGREVPEATVTEVYQSLSGSKEPT